MLIKDWRQLFLPIWAAVVCWPPNVVQGLQRSVIVMCMDRTPVVFIDVLDIRRNFYVCIFHVCWLFFKNLSSFSFGLFLSVSSVWYFSLLGLLLAVAAEMMFKFIFSIKPTSTDLTLMRYFLLVFLLNVMCTTAVMSKNGRTLRTGVLCEWFGLLHLHCRADA